jgi:ABC-type phosphate/phosphonate transport system substrate-binding protein
MRTILTTGTARSRRAVLRLAAAAGVAGAAGLLARPGAAPAYQVAPDSPADAARECAFGVFPYLPPLSLDRIFAPIVGDLGRVLGQTVQLRTKSTFEAFAEALVDGAYDLALAHPFLYLTAAAHGYLPLVRVDEPLRMVFLARPEAGLARLADLAGRTLALPPAMSAVSEMARGALAEAGLRPGADVRFQHLASKMSCVQAVTLGTAAACGLPSFAVTQLEAEMRQAHLRPFHETTMPVSLAVVAHDRLPGPARERVRDLLVGWSGTAEGRAILAAAGWPGFVPARDEDYDVARAMVARGGQQAGLGRRP